MASANAVLASSNAFAHCGVQVMSLPLPTEVVCKGASLSAVPGKNR